MESEKLQEFGIQRLLNFTMSEAPPKLLKSERIPLIAADPAAAFSRDNESATRVEVAEPLPGAESQRPGADTECMLARGSWQCRCQRCLSADRTA